MKYFLYESIYLRESIYFFSFEELKNYYNKPEAESLEELQEALIKEYGGMIYPVVKNLYD